MNTHKKLKEVLYSVIAVAVIIWAIVYVQVKSVATDSVAPPVVDDHLTKISASIRVPEQTPELKSKLENISASLNKKK